MVSVDRKDWYADIKIWILIVDGWKSGEFSAEFADCTDSERLAHENPGALPSSGLLRSSIPMGLSPKVYSRNRAIVR